MKCCLFLLRIEPDMFEYNKFVALQDPRAILQIVPDED